MPGLCGDVQGCFGQHVIVCETEDGCLKATLGLSQSCDTDSDSVCGSRQALQ